MMGMFHINLETQLHNSGIINSFVLNWAIRGIGRLTTSKDRRERRSKTSSSQIIYTIQEVKPTFTNNITHYVKHTEKIIFVRILAD